MITVKNNWVFNMLTIYPNLDCRDQDRDWYSFRLDFETESETVIFWVSVLRPRLRLDFSESQCQDRGQDCIFLSPNNKTKSETDGIIWVSTSRAYPWP